MIGHTKKIGSNIGHMQSVGNGKSLEPHELTKWKYYDDENGWIIAKNADLIVKMPGRIFLTQKILAHYFTL